MTSSGPTLYWSYRCSFIFEGLQTQQINTFTAACIVTFALAFLSSSIKHIQQLILSLLIEYEETNCDANEYELVCYKQEECRAAKEYQTQQINSEQSKQTSIISLEKIIKIIGSLVSAALHITINLILMQLNGFVIIAVIIGYLSAYYIFQEIQTKPPTRVPANVVQSSA